MASNRKTFAIAVALELTADQIKALAGMVPGDESEEHKVRSITTKAVLDIAGGGLLLEPGEVARITEATGVDPSCGEDLIETLSQATGIEEGKPTYKVSIDPVYMEPLKEFADYRGQPVETLIQDTVDACFENNWYESIPEQPRHIRMSEEEAKGLEEMLEGKFTNGTELAALIRKMLGGESLFAEETPAEESNVGSEATA